MKLEKECQTSLATQDTSGNGSGSGSRQNIVPCHCTNDESRNKGSMSVETTIVLFLLVVAVWVLYSFSQAVFLQLRLQTALNETAKELSAMYIFSIEAFDNNGTPTYDFTEVSRALAAVKDDSALSLNEEERDAFLAVCYGDGVDQIRLSFIRDLFLKKLTDADSMLDIYLRIDGIRNGSAGIRNIEAEFDGESVTLKLRYDEYISLYGLSDREMGIRLPIEIHSKMRLWQYENEAMSEWRRKRQ